MWRGLVTKLVQNLNIAREFRSNNGITQKFNGIKLSSNKINIQDLNMKIIKKFLNTNLDSEFKNMPYYNTTFGQMDSDAWAKIYVLAHLLPVNNKVMGLQYKILFRFVVTNKLLYQIQIKTTPNCPICEIDTQTIEHVFFECKKIKTFWLQIIDLWNNYNNTRVILSVKDVILGYKFQDLKSNKALNIILLSKYYIIIY